MSRPSSGSLCFALLRYGLNPQGVRCHHPSGHYGRLAEAEDYRAHSRFHVLTSADDFDTIRLCHSFRLLIGRYHSRRRLADRWSALVPHGKVAKGMTGSGRHSGPSELTPNALDDDFHPPVLFSSCRVVRTVRILVGRHRVLFTQPGRYHPRPVNPSRTGQIGLN